MGREELIGFLRTLAPESKVESLLAIATILQSQFDVLRREGDRYFRTERGDNVLASLDPAALGDWLLTRVLGVDHVVAALHNGPRTTADLIALLRKVNPGWRTDFVPKVLLAWLRSLRAIEADSARRLTLAEIGPGWAAGIDWAPETVPVQPGWYDPGPLLGYTNPIRIDEYVCPPFLKFLLAAAGNLGRPYVVVLDEMNLSHPEQYMAPLLSAMETGDWIHLYGKGDIFDEIPRAVRYPRNLVLYGIAGQKRR